MAPKSLGEETPNLAKDQAAMDRCCASLRRLEFREGDFGFDFVIGGFGQCEISVWRFVKNVKIF